VHDTVAVPIGSRLPEGGVQMGGATPTLSVAVAPKVTTAPPGPVAFTA
jgi:hypothetical protein